MRHDPCVTSRYQVDTLCRLSIGLDADPWSLLVIAHLASSSDESSNGPGIS